jgi:hypothetical protein
VRLGTSVSNDGRLVAQQAHLVNEDPKRVISRREVRARNLFGYRPHKLPRQLFALRSEVLLFFAPSSRDAGGRAAEGSTFGPIIQGLAN